MQYESEPYDPFADTDPPFEDGMPDVPREPKEESQ